MANAKEEKLVTDESKIDPDAAKRVADRIRADEKDGKVPDKTDAGSGIVMKPAPGDSSTWTYDPQNVEKDESVTAKPSKNSGEPVHDRS